MKLARKLDEGHEVWYVDECPDLVEAMIKAAFSVNEIGGCILSVNFVPRWSNEEEIEYWSALITVDGSVR